MNVQPRRLARLATSLSVVVLVSVALSAQDNARTRANYKLAEKFSNDFVNQFVHSTSVNPRWIGETDRFWHEYQTSDGNHYWLVDPEGPTRRPLFNHARMAGMLSEEVRKPIDATHLDLGNLEIDDQGTTLKFVVEDTRFEYALETGTLVNKGEVPENERGRRGARGGRGGRRGGGRGRRGGGQDEDDEEEPPGAHRNFSPDYTAYVFGQDHDLYLVEAPDSVRAEIEALDAEIKAAEEAREAEGGEAEQEADEDEMDPREKWAEEIDESQAAQLTDDGEEFYSWARPGGGGRRNLEEKLDEEELHKKVRPNVQWAPDSSAFYISRNDSRGVNELFLVNSLAEPRPALERYQYAMPGEERISNADLFFFDRNRGELVRAEPLWVQESYLNMHWMDEKGDRLRFIRRDRLRRNLDLVELDIRTGESDVILSERFEVGLIGIQQPRYLENSDQFIWWSERSGWGHYYLYSNDGELQNLITPGSFYARQIVDLDEDKGILYFRGNGREKGENIYYNHLYRVFLDGTGTELLDPGDATHSSVLSPSRRYLVDNFNRVDQAPKSVLRAADGRQLPILDLEETDLSALYATGWKMPETFKVKAADGITDLFGNMWKPFDFDETRKYPIIAHVYPGPQQEGVTHTFSATSGGRQALANLGFIVIQVGHRGGTPGRSKAYQNFSYFNMRDYGLPDKKAAIEKLAAIHPFIDVERVGIYGHSGGGFMTGTALMLPPYNDFFKVGVSSAGNHDNNVYNNSWSERYHGLREVEVEAETEGETNGAENGGQRGQRGNRGRGQRGGRGQGRGGRGRGTQDQDEQQDEEQEETNDSDRFEIHIPANHELAENLKGHLLLVHGDMDNNVHPAGTIRLVDALIKANKRFDLLIIPGARHGFGAASGYFTQRMWEYFSEHLLDDYQTGPDILEKAGSGR